MEEGFLLENAQHAYGTTRWIEGAPEKSFWQGLRTKGKRQLELTTYRCTRCGYLESWARE